jgi:lysophospholipase L1-like esterase
MRRLALLGVVAVVAFVAAACKPDVTKEVLFVNDSVTAQSVAQLVNEFNAVPRDDPASRYAPNFGSSVAGIGLRQVPGLPAEDVDAYWPAHLTSLLDHVEPEVIVVELGYNDCGYDLSEYGDDIDDFMEVIPSDTPVHWLTVADAADDRICDDIINDALDEATERWSNLTLLDFAAHMDGHPEWTQDNIHLNETGRSQYAAWLHDELDALYDPEEEPEPQVAPAAN